MSKHVDYALQAKRRREKQTQAQADRELEGWGSEIICVALMLCSCIPIAPPDFSELLMFVISCITLEDSDCEKKCRIYMGQILTIAGSWVLEKKKRCKLC